MKFLCGVVLKECVVSLRVRGFIGFVILALTLPEKLSDKKQIFVELACFLIKSGMA